MSWYSFRPYVSVAERRRKALHAAQKMAKRGQAMAPIQLEGRRIASTFWGKAWCDNLESYSDYENRLPRGRSYVRNGSVIDLQIAAGKVTALVQGSSLYKIAIAIRPLAPSRWKDFKSAAAGKITNLFDLLQGRLGSELLAEIAAQDRGLFPSPKEIELDCSCPDWADMCKHVAAALYGVGARLDTKPELFFILRGLDIQELVTAASDAVVAAPNAETSAPALAGANLSELFGVEIESTGSSPTPAPGEPPSPTPAGVVRTADHKHSRASVRSKVAAPSVTRTPPSPRPAGPAVEASPGTKPARKSRAQTAPRIPQARKIKPKRPTRARPAK